MTSKKIIALCILAVLAGVAAGAGCAATRPSWCGPKAANAAWMYGADRQCLTFIAYGESNNRPGQYHAQAFAIVNGESVWLQSVGGDVYKTKRHDFEVERIYTPDAFYKTFYQSAPANGRP